MSPLTRVVIRMSSSDSMRAPRRPESDRALSRPFTTRVRLKPRRDALTRVRHDLRSLVHTVLGYSALLKTENHGSLTEAQRAFLGHIQSATREIEQLVDVWLELSRPEGAAPSESRAPIALGALLARSRHRLTTAQIETVPWITSVAEQRPVAIDVDSLERALLEIARVVMREESEACLLSAREEEGRVVLALAMSSAMIGELVAVDGLDNELSNREFVRLKLSEVLLAREGTNVLLSADARYAEVWLP